jgi:CHAD domain-containing protein
LKVRSLVKPRVATVLALEDSAILGRIDFVHEFRVATRSLRAALLTLSRPEDARLVRKTRKSLQVATRALAESRDRDVGRVLLFRLPRGTETEAALKKQALALSDRERAKSHLSGLSLWPMKLDRRLITLLKRRQASLSSIIRSTRAEAWQQRRRALEVLQKLGRRFDPVGLHDVRRRVRSLRYAVELLAEIDAGARARVAQLKPLQSMLGDIQDRMVLSNWLARQATRIKRSDPPFAHYLSRQSAEFRRQSMKVHADFLKLRPKDLLQTLALHIDEKGMRLDCRSEKTRAKHPRRRA